MGSIAHFQDEGVWPCPSQRTFSSSNISSPSELDQAANWKRENARVQFFEATVQKFKVWQLEDFHIRTLPYEVSGRRIVRQYLHQQVATVPGALVLDSRGIFDAATRNLSALHGLRDSRAGYELSLAMLNAKEASTRMRWVCGIAQLADSLIKFTDRKTFLRFMSQKQYWRLVDDPTFAAGRKINRKIFRAETEGDGRVLLWRPLGNGQKVQLAMDRNRSILWNHDMKAQKGIMDASTAVACDLSCAEASCNRREGLRAKRAKQCPASRTLRWIIPLFSVRSGTLFASLLIVVITCRYVCQKWSHLVCKFQVFICAGVHHQQILQRHWVLRPS